MLPLDQHTPPQFLKMSLATQQRILQLRSERDDLLRRISVGEDTPRVKQLLSQTNNNIARFEKQWDSEMADAHAKKAAADAKKARDSPANSKPRDPLPSDVDLSCVDCSSTFTFTGKDQLFFTKNNYKPPTRCSSCRDAKKNAKPAGVQINCSGCKTDFFFSDAKAAIFEEKGWAIPKWCSSCKAAKNAKSSKSA